MRTELMCVLALLGIAPIALAQNYPANPYYPGSPPNYPTQGIYYGYPGFGQTGYPGSYYSYPSYGSYPGYQFYPQSYPQTSSYPRQLPMLPTSRSVGSQSSIETPIEPSAPATTLIPPGEVTQSTPRSSPATALIAEPAVVTEAAGTNSGWSPAVVGTAHYLTGLLWNPPSGPLCKDHCDRYWVNADATLSWFKPANLPVPLVTTGSPLDPTPAAIGNPGTSDVVGNTLHFNSLAGVRFDAGFYLDDKDRFAVDFGGLYIFPGHQSYQVISDGNGNPVIGRPFFDSATGIQRSELNSYPTGNPTTNFVPAVGGSTVDARTELFGGEINARAKFILTPRLRLEALAGARYMHLAEDLLIQDQTQFLPSGFTLPVYNGAADAYGLYDQDRFKTSNNFYGMQVGGALCWEPGWFFIKVAGKVAFGANQERADVSGFTTFNTTTGPLTVPGGVLALPSNIGSYSRTVVGYVPDVGFTLGANLTSWLRLTAGYSFLYWNAVARPGNQISPVANATQIPGDPLYGAAGFPSTANPLFHFNDEHFWVQTVSCGLEIHY